MARKKKEETQVIDNGFFTNILVHLITTIMYFITLINVNIAAFGIIFDKDTFTNTTIRTMAETMSIYITVGSIISIMILLLNFKFKDDKKRLSIILVAELIILIAESINFILLFV